MRKLGKKQEGILAALKEHHEWYSGGFGCGWTYGTVANTRRLLESLVARGLVRKTIVPKNGTLRTIYRPS